MVAILPRNAKYSKHCRRESVPGRKAGAELLKAFEQSAAVNRDLLEHLAKTPIS
jgi:hypothetical protein